MAKKQKVLITKKIPDIAKKMLQDAGFTVIGGNNSQSLTPQALIKKSQGVDAVLCLLTDEIDAHYIKKIKGKVKIIANYAVGYDNIAIEATKKAGIVVTNTPGILSDAVAEHTIALIMAVSRRIVEADAYMRAKSYKGWEPMLLLGSDVASKKIAIIGLGRIGQGVAKIMHAGFGSEIMYVDKYKNIFFEKEYRAKRVTLETALKQADIISLHVPLLPSTTHLIGKKQIQLMKKNAIIINTSRGPVIDEHALYTALKKNQIGGAGLDVFEFEPKPVTGLTKLKNVVLTPHIASATLETRVEMATLAARNIIEVLTGKEPISPVV